MAADMDAFAFARDIPPFHRAQRGYRRKRELRSLLRFVVGCWDMKVLEISAGLVHGSAHVRHKKIHFIIGSKQTPTPPKFLYVRPCSRCDVFEGPKQSTRTLAIQPYEDSSIQCELSQIIS